MLVVKYNEENVRFELVSSNLSGKIRLGISDDKSLNLKMPKLKIDLRFSFEKWFCKSVLAFN
jgi:hypothetical protein